MTEELDALAKKLKRLAGALDEAEAGDGDPMDAEQALSNALLRAYRAGDLVTAATAQAAAAEEKARADALEQQVADLLADVPCSCGYDNPDDVCMKHLPLFRQLKAQLAEAEMSVTRTAEISERAFALADRANARADRAEAALAAQDWQPIETAPKDETAIDLWSSRGFRLPKCAWDVVEYAPTPHEPDVYGWTSVDGHGSVERAGPFTHWRPLPASPSQPHARTALDRMLAEAEAKALRAAADMARGHGTSWTHSKDTAPADAIADAILDMIPKEGAK